MKIRCHTCFNLMEFCQCGLPGDVVEGEVTESGLLLPRSESFTPEDDVVIVAIVGGDDSDYDINDDPTDDEVFASMAKHPTGAYTLLQEIEEFLHGQD